MDPTALVVELLTEALPVKVTTEVPSTRPDSLVTVDLIADQSTEFLLLPTYQILCWGRSDEEAHGMARACLDALWSVAEDHPYLFACQMQTLSRDEWSATGQARYILTVDLTINTDE